MNLNLKSDCLRSLFQHNVTFYFKVSDENKRELLGDILHQIRFPTMTLEEFLHNVSNTEVLTDREVRGIVTVLGGAKPIVPVTFPDKPRGGTFEEIRFNNIKEIKKINVKLPDGIFCDISLKHLNADEIFELSEIHFCNPADFPYDVVRVNEISANQILKIPNRLVNSLPESSPMESFPVYKAVFNKPIKLSSNSARVHLKTSTYSGTAPSAYITGASSRDQSIKLKDKTIKIKPSPDPNYSLVNFIWSQSAAIREKDARSWCFLLGIKGRMVET